MFVLQGTVIVLQSPQSACRYLILTLLPLARLPDTW